jgi:excisionase family DNA binding protein
MTKPIETIPVKPAVLTTREAAQYLKISLPTLHRRVRAGGIPYLRIGRSLRFRVEDLDAFLASLVTSKWKDYKKKPQGPDHA